MNIKFQGFEFDIEGTGVTWDEVVRHLESVSQTEIFQRPFNRVICVDSTSNADYILGLFVSIKDQKRFCQIRESHGQFELTAQDLDVGARMADFNFFIINKQTKKGIYQYYHQSCSLRQFMGFVESRFFDFRDIKERSITQSTTLDVEEKAELQENLRNSVLRGCVLVRPENFDQLLESLDQIKEMKFNVSTVVPDSPLFRPLRDVVKKRTERVLFNKDMLSSVRSSIREFARSADVSDVAVRGKSSETGIETTIHLFDNLEDFGQYDYDELTQHFAVDLRSFATSAILELLLEAASENSPVIEG
jgi:hypothetical protein